MSFNKIKQYYDDPCHCSSYDFKSCFFCDKKICHHIEANFCKDCYQSKKNKLRINKFGKFLDPKTKKPLRTCLCGELIDYDDYFNSSKWGHRPLVYGEKVALLKNIN